MVGFRWYIYPWTVIELMLVPTRRRSGMGIASKRNAIYRLNDWDMDGQIHGG